MQGNAAEGGKALVESGEEVREKHLSSRVRSPAVCGTNNIARRLQDTVHKAYASSLRVCERALPFLFNSAIL